MRFILEMLSHVDRAMVLKLLPSVMATVGATLFGWLLSGWRWRCRLKQVLTGDGMDVVAVEQVLLTRTRKGQAVLRLRTCGAVPIEQALPNPVARSRLIKMAAAATDIDPLLLLRGPEGFYLRNEMKKIVSNFVANRPFQHDLWVMTLVRESKELREHQSITVLLVRVKDLEESFGAWGTVQKIQVEEQSDAARLLTLHLVALARSNEVKERRAVEARSMCVLDLPLDVRYCSMPSEAVDWNGRLRETLVRLGLTTGKS